MKQRKTRQQKIIAELRRQVSEINSTFESQRTYGLKDAQRPISITLTGKQFITASTTIARKAISDLTNPFLIDDLKKTMLLTGFIVIGELLLFLVLKNHLIVLPMLSY